MKKFIFVFAALLFVHVLFSQNKTTAAKLKTTQKTGVPAAGRLVEVTTDSGTMVIRLYDSTPLHRDNFIKLVQEGFYDSLLFHRVIRNFMIQGGDPTSKSADSSAMLGSGEVPGEHIPAEFRNNLIHKKGVLAAARDNNPEKASSNCQFYIVEGQKYNDTTLNEMECAVRQNNPGFTYTTDQRSAYKTIGGTPFLDQNYTVFGEVIKGLDVIDKIASVPCNPNDRPLQNVHMKMKMLN
jgi:peptidyl-prolyl cis-trans isomerase B (cyclophilin B)